MVWGAFHDPNRGGFDHAAYRSESFRSAKRSGRKCFWADTRCNDRGGPVPFHDAGDDWGITGFSSFGALAADAGDAIISKLN